VNILTQKASRLLHSYDPPLMSFVFVAVGNDRGEG